MPNKPIIDVYKAKAAEHFKVDYDKVTPEQRRVGKLLAFGETYGITPKLKEER